MEADFLAWQKEYIIPGSGGGNEFGKPSGFMTNSPAVARALSRLCKGAHGLCSRPAGGRHQLCSGKHARAAAKYPQELCRAVLRGVRDQLREDDLLKDGCFGVQVPDEDAEVERHTRGPAQGYSGKYRDDLTGQVLKDAANTNGAAKDTKGSLFASGAKTMVIQGGGRSQAPQTTA